MCFTAQLLLWASSDSVDIYIAVSLKYAVCMLVEIFKKKKNIDENGVFIGITCTT